MQGSVPETVGFGAVKTLGFATSIDWPDLAPDDRLLYEPLAALGIEARPVRWDDENGTDAAGAANLDAIVIRSTWGYIHHLAEFAAWIDHLDAKGPAVWNPPDVLRWNMNKRYLIDLEQAGIPVVETEWVRRDSRTTLADISRDRAWDEMVIKPAVSAAAWQTHRLQANDEHAEALLESMTREGDVMVQPFLQPIVDEGEWSLMFFNGRYSHAVLKRPGAGDYRVQEFLGGSSTTPEPPVWMVEQAARILPYAPGDLLYARVDGIRDGDTFVLLELEVLEPSLFLDRSPLAPARFAEAIAARLLV